MTAILGQDRKYEPASPTPSPRATSSRSASATTKPIPDAEAIGTFWEAWCAGRGTFEVSAPKTRRDGPNRFYGPAAGYFDSRDAFVREVSRVAGDDAEAIYVTLNPVEPALLARAANRLTTDKNVGHAGDADVPRLTRLLIDIDPVRPSKIGATDAERLLAKQTLVTIRHYLTTEHSFPEPVLVGSSGNGGILCYTLDLPNDRERIALLQRCLDGLAHLFNDATVSIDQAVANASRHVKIGGTVAAKGDHTSDRPWRLAVHRHNPDAPAVPVDRLATLAALAPEPEPRTLPATVARPARSEPPSRTWDVADVLSRSGIAYREKQTGYATIYELVQCLTSTEHSDGGAVIEMANGALSYKCQHNSCRGVKWEDVRPLLDIPTNGHGGAYPLASPPNRLVGQPPPSSAAPAPSVGSVSSSTKGSKESPWPERQPLPPERPPAPTLPDWMVPEPFRAWVTDIADRARLPLEMAAVPALTAAGAVVGRAVGIKPNQYDDFVSVPNFWGAMVARPGWMKSGAMKEAFRPLGLLVDAARAAFQMIENDNAAKRDRIEAEIDALKALMREAARKDQPLTDLETRLAGKRRELTEAVTTERRFLTHDATVEKLGELLRDNPRGILLARDEISGWLAALDRDGREGDREFFLESWNGTDSFTVDRIGRGTITIPALTVSIFGGIQPAKVKPLVDAAIDGTASDDGLVQRFQLLVWPDRLPAWVKADRWPDAGHRRRADAVFAYLAADDLAARVGAHDGEIPSLRFTPNAQAVFDDWRDQLEPRLRSDELNDSPAFASHLSKYRSLMPALALIFHLIDLADPKPRRDQAPPVSSVIGEGSVRLAAAWCEYLEAHAKKLYAVEMEPGAAEARALSAKIEAGAIKDGDTVRDLYRAQWSGLRTPEKVTEGLRALESLGWVRRESVETSGRDTDVVRLHPDLRPKPKEGTADV